MKEWKQFLELLGDWLETEEEKTVNLKIAQYKLSTEKSREKIVEKKMNAAS